MKDMSKQTRFRSSGLFICVFLVALTVTFFYGDKVAAVAYPKMAADLLVKRSLNSQDHPEITQLIKSNHELSYIEGGASNAKTSMRFWMGEIEGKGAAINLVEHSKLLNSLFPGYGDSLHQDLALWQNYFKAEFGPDSFLDVKPEWSQQGFRVAYSWTGCFDIYKKYGADVLIMGSSEVYKSLIPGLLAKELDFLSSTPTKVLYCVTHSMPVDAVKDTAEELLNLREGKPKLIIWGYSFWLAYERSTKMAIYRKEKESALSAYRFRKENEKQQGSSLSQFKKLLGAKGAVFFPKITWDDTLNFTYAKKQSFRNVHASDEAEGVHLEKSVALLGDDELSRHLLGKLKPFYDINQGISPADCSMNLAKSKFKSATEALKKLTPNIFIYLAPTTMHHRATVPECFIPTVRSTLEEAGREAGVHILTISTEDFGLTDRDFVYPTLKPNSYYFDINHANYVGGQKITKRISTWVGTNMKRSSEFLSR